MNPSKLLFFFTFLSALLSCNYSAAKRFFLMADEESPLAPGYIKTELYEVRHYRDPTQTSENIDK
jgi:hypothetical protein